MQNFIDRFAVTVGAVKRLAMWHTLSERLPIYLVPEFPKSGGTWFSQMLSDCMDLPFARNTTQPRFEKCVMSGHHLYSSHFKNVTIVVRDGRDIMVSAYYYMLFKNDINKQFGVDRHRRHLPFENYDDIRANLPKFIDYMFTTYAKKRFHFSWADFIDSWWDYGFPTVRYEDLLVKPADELIRVTEALTGTPCSPERAQEIVDKYNFKKMSGRKPGQENKRSFVRKGIAGDWKNQFSKEACEVFDKHAGKQLIRVGYEESHAWVDEFSPAPVEA